MTSAQPDFGHALDLKPEEVARIVLSSIQERFEQLDLRRLPLDV